MSEKHEVISAFLDDEPFDSGELAEALSEPAGRALLIDLVALRHLAQPDGNAVAPADRKRWRSSLRALAAAAAVLMALGGGYFAGQRRSQEEKSAAPPPTRVVQAPAVWSGATFEVMP